MFKHGFVSAGGNFAPVRIFQHDPHPQMLRQHFLRPGRCRNIKAEACINKSAQGREQRTILLGNFVHDDGHMLGNRKELFTVSFGKVANEGGYFFS